MGSFVGPTLIGLLEVRTDSGFKDAACASIIDFYDGGTVPLQIHKNSA